MSCRLSYIISKQKKKRRRVKQYTKGCTITKEKKEEKRKERKKIMVAYLIFTRVRTTDKQQLEEYSKKVPATLAGYDFKILSAYSPFEVIFLI